MQPHKVALLACWLATIGAAAAQLPEESAPPRASLPFWKRLLLPDDEKHAKDLVKRRDEAISADDYAVALSAAEDVLSLREREQGADHWQAVDARWHVDAIRTSAALPDEARAEWNAAYADELRTEKLHGQGRYAEALPLIERIRALSTSVLGPDHPHTAIRENDLAVLLNALNDFAAAEPHYQKALEVRRRVLGEDHPDTAFGYNNSAYNLQSTDSAERADPLYQQALAIFRRVHGEDHENTAMACGNAASCKFAQGDYAAAAPLSAQVLKTFLRLLPADDPRIASGYNNLAVVLNAQGKYAEGEALNRRALEFRQRYIPDSPDTGLSHNNLAFSLLAQERYDEAEVESKLALEIFQRVLPAEHTYFVLTYTNLASSLNSREQYAEAEPHVNEALRIVERIAPPGHPYRGTTLNNAASNLNAQGRWGEAEPIYRQALELRRRVLGDGHPDTALSWANLAGNLHAQSRPAETREALLAGAAGFDAARMRIAGRGLERATYAGEHSPYPLLAIVEAHAGQTRAAWQALEADLARGLLDESAARAGTALADDEEARRAELQATLKELEPQAQALASIVEPTDDQRRQFDSLLAERAAAERELVGLAAEFSRRQMADLPAVQAVLAEDEAFVAWLDVVGEGQGVEEHWGCVLRSSGDPIFVRLPGGGGEGAWAEDDLTLPLRLRQALSEEADTDEIEELADLLAAQRIEPLLPHLSGVRRLYVAPVNLMAGVPVDVLTDRFTIGYVPSGTQFVRLKNLARPTGAARLLALGDPVFARPGDEFGPLPERMDLPYELLAVARLLRGDPRNELPGTKVEIARLQALMPDGATVLADSDASEQRLAALRDAGELASYRYLHLATHGVVNRESAFESALILSQDGLSSLDDFGSGEAFYDGRLTANEILEHWQLDAELVTLSACESGLGRSGGGEGFLGFAQALLLAGSRSVCLSLWEVDDTATALLMDRFYQNLLGKRGGQAEPMPKAEALAEAKRWLRSLTVADAIPLAENLSGVTRGVGHDTEIVDLVPPDAPDLDAHPYEHPFYWAAFVLIGDPE